MKNIVLTLLACTPLAAYGGALVTAETRYLTTGEIELFQIRAENGNLVMTTLGAGSRSGSAAMIDEARSAASTVVKQPPSSADLSKRDEMIFNNELKTIWFDEGDGQIETMNKDRVREMTAGRSSAADSENMQNSMRQYQDAMKEVEQRMGDLPTDQQEILKGLGIGGGANAPSFNPGKQTEYRETGDIENVAGYRAKRVDAYEGDILVMRLWVVPWRDISHGGELEESFKNLDAFYVELMDEAGGPMGMPGFGATSPGELFTAAGGMPVKTQEIGDGVEIETTLQEIEGENFSDETFIR